MFWRTRVDVVLEESIPAIHGERAFIPSSDAFLHSFK
jgi:hypothetical protein